MRRRDSRTAGSAKSISYVGAAKQHQHNEINRMGQNVLHLLFIRLRVAPEHGTNTGPHRASSHVAVVMSSGPTSKLETWLIINDCK